MKLTRSLPTATQELRDSFVALFMAGFAELKAESVDDAECLLLMNALSAFAARKLTKK